MTGLEAPEPDHARSFRLEDTRGARRILPNCLVPDPPHSQGFEFGIQPR